jgi:hypothetical protein
VSSTLHQNNQPNRRQPLRPLNQTRNIENVMKLKRKKKQRTHYKKCCFKGCTNTSKTSSLERLPPKPKDLPNHNTARWIALERYYRKAVYYKLFLKQMGIKASDVKSDMRICKDHETVTVTKKSIIKKNGIERQYSYELTVPSGKGVKIDVGLQHLSASVAADRSGNERAVNVVKRSGFLKRGLRPAQSPAQIDDVWKAWSFQANFMFKPVL